MGGEPVTEKRIMMIQIVETVEDVPSVFAHTCHPDGVHSTTLELPPELVIQLHAALSPVYEKHRIQCHEAMKRSWQKIIDGISMAEMIKNQFLLHDAEYQAREEAKKAGHKSRNNR